MKRYRFINSRRENPSAQRCGERGAVSSWLFLLSAALAVPYLYIGDEGLKKWMTADEARVAVIVGTAVFAFALAAAVRFFIIEKMGGTGIHRQLRNDLRDLRAMVTEQSAALESIERDLRSRGSRMTSSLISPHGTLCIEAAKRVLHSIRVRVIDAEELVKSGNRYSLEDAVDLLRGQPVVAEGLNKISIGGALAPYVPPVGWLRVMPMLLEEIGRSIRRAA